jgi:hypothetical protein
LEQLLGKKEVEVALPKKHLGTEWMNTAQKVELVTSVVDKHTLASALGALELPKSTWYYHQRHEVDYETEYAHRRSVPGAISRQHPGYAYRRTTAKLHEAYQEQVNHRVVQRLHPLWGLALLRTARAPELSGIC